MFPEQFYRYSPDFGFVIWNSFFLLHIEKGTHSWYVCSLLFYFTLFFFSDQCCQIRQSIIIFTKIRRISEKRLWKHWKQINKSKSAVPKIAILALAIVFAAGLFVVGFDQGHIFSLVYGEQAFVDLTIHELTHDMRHAAGFPCH